MSDFEPEGPIVSATQALAPDSKADNVVLSCKLPDHKGSVILIPLSVEHAQDLYTNLAGLQNAHLYKYMPSGPYTDLESFTEHMKFLCESPIFFPFTIFSNDAAHQTNQKQLENPPFKPATPVGIICLMNIVPAHRTIEIGHVLFGPTLQRTTAATESTYLLMKYCFEELHYLRVEWKANNLNEPSKRAALRLGFVFEGIFRKHYVIKGKGRDSAWFSVTDDEWFKEGEGGVKEALEKWLSKENFDTEGKQRRKLEDIRGKERA